MARLNINVSEKLLSQLRIIAAVQDKTVTDIVVELITAYVRDKKKDALAATSEILADHNADADKTVIAKNGDHNETQQVTEGGKQQLDDVDRLRTILTEIAAREPAAVFVADDHCRYVRAWRKIQRELEAAGIKAVASQPKLNGKGQRAYRLDDAAEAPETSQKNRHDL